MFELYFNQIINFSIRVIIALIIFAVGLKLISILRKVIRKFMEKSKADRGVIQFTDAFVKTSLIIILVLSIATHFGLDVTSVATIIGSAGVTIALALQGSLSNFVGGILLLILKPFKVGDYIIEDTNKNEGVVSEISLFYTKLMTADGKVVILPNGTLANTSMTNVTDQKYRRLDLKISVSYDADIKTAKSVLEDILKKQSTVNHEMEELVFVDELADSAVMLGMRCYIKQEDYWNTRWSLLEEVKYKLDENQIEIPYNHMAVKILK